jgi:hypothetical protein
MFAGHFAVAAAVKAKNPQVPLWSLMLGTQLLDVIFVPLFVSGVETMETVGSAGYGEAVIHADYTHSLMGALLIAIVAGILAGYRWGRRAGYILASVVFSHWILDLVVHRRDLPILPGNLGDLPLLGFGLWQWPAASIALEVLLILIGGSLYFRSSLARAGRADLNPGYHQTKGRAIMASCVMAALLVLSLVTDTLGIG